jgi:hypothetical protein
MQATADLRLLSHVLLTVVFPSCRLLCSALTYHVALAAPPASCKAIRVPSKPITLAANASTVHWGYFL